MKFSLYTCCFRVEVEFFELKFVLRKYEVLPRGAAFPTERKLLQLLAARMKQKEETTP